MSHRPIDSAVSCLGGTPAAAVGQRAAVDEDLKRDGKNA
jgi:hypothetical protein